MILSIILPLAFISCLGDDSDVVKVMFFGDSTVSGVHNAEIDICPFRYHFQRKINEIGSKVSIVGTNNDPEGTCKRIGDDLDGHNNGYRNAGTDELLDYITADLQFLHRPVDYIVTSLGSRDCIDFRDGGDFQIVSQSVRRIMGRLLTIFENSKIVHVPILFPEAAGNSTLKCMQFVNEKLRQLYDAEKSNDRIQVIKLQNVVYDSDYFFTLGNEPEVEEEIAPVVVPAPSTEEVEDPTPVDEPSEETSETSKTPRRSAEIPLMFLPKWNLGKEIAQMLVNVMDFDFRAQTMYPTPEVTKEPDYYGYDWCMTNYEEDECFEYYYGYTWCLENYGEDECYNYYYGDMEEWGDDESYKWCTNFYDEEYCSFAYRGEQPDDWDWLSFGYHDCLKTSSADQCFEQYYGYAWCLDKYDDSECYEYYYGGDEWVWDQDSSYKWCINFYSESECTEKYLGAEMSGAPDTANTFFAIAVFVVVFAGLVWVSWKKFTCFKSKKKYNRLDPTDEGGEDEVELL